jgi:uncharacterized protein (TIGR00251 family)
MAINTEVIKIIDQDIKLQVQVQPKSSKIGWGKILDNRIQLKVNSPPIDGAANQACIKFLSKAFKTAKSNITLINGEKNRFKVFLIQNYNHNTLNQFLEKYVKQ